MEAARPGRLHRWNRAARTGAGIVCVLVLVRYVQRQLKWRQCVWETYLRWWDSPTADRLFAIYDTSGDDVIDLDVVPHMPIEYCRAAVAVLLALLEPTTLTLYSRVAPHLHCSQHCTSGPMLLPRAALRPVPYPCAPCVLTRCLQVARDLASWLYWLRWSAAGAPRCVHWILLWLARRSCGVAIDKVGKLKPHALRGMAMGLERYQHPH